MVRFSDQIIDPHSTNVVDACPKGRGIQIGGKRRMTDRMSLVFFSCCIRWSLVGVVVNTAHGMTGDNSRSVEEGTNEKPRTPKRQRIVRSNKLIGKKCLCSHGYPLE